MEVLIIVLILALGIGAQWKEDTLNYKIKYDTYTKSIYLYVAIMFTIAGVVMYALNEYLYATDATTGVLAFSTVSLLGIPFIAFIAWFGFMRSSFYLCRLKKYGYELPYRKKTYDYLLENLPKKEEIVSPRTGRNKESLILATGCLCMIAATVICMLVFNSENSILEDAWQISCFGGVPLILFWLFRFVMYVVQSDNAKYKDSVVVDDERKIRRPLENGLMEFVLFSLLTLVGFAVLDAYAGVVFRAREQAGWYQ